MGQKIIRGQMIAIAVLLVLFGFVVFQKISNPKSLTTSAATVTVKITDSRFIPATLKVKPGTEITWENKAKVDHQISIDSYFGTSQSPTLDKGLLVRPGEKYTLRFNQPGTYQYSDPLHAQLRGEIIVK